MWNLRSLENWQERSNSIIFDVISNKLELIYVKWKI